MTPAARPEPPGAFAALAAQARNTRADLLVGVETLGFVGALAVFIWIPERLVLALPFLALGMFGLWGAAEHARHAAHGSMSRARRGAVTGIQLFAAVAGTVAAVLAGYALVGRIIGTVVS